MVGIYPGQSAARIGCDHLPPAFTLHGGSGVLGDGALMWSVAVHWVHWPWGIWGRADEGQPSPVSPWGTLPELYSNVRWLLLVLGLELPKGSQAVNLS